VDACDTGLAQTRGRYQALVRGSRQARGHCYDIQELDAHRLVCSLPPTPHNAARIGHL
jgi:hypothetical protein